MELASFLASIGQIDMVWYHDDGILCLRRSCLQPSEDWSAGRCILCAIV